MRTRLFNMLRRIGLRRLSVVLAMLLFVGMASAFLLLAFAPAMLSAPYSQKHMQRFLSARMNRQVSWTGLTASWSGGLAVKGLSLGSGAAPLLKAAIGEAIIVPRIDYLHGRLRADLDLRIRTVTLELAPGPPTPPKPYREPLTGIAEALQRFEKISWPLPLDVGVNAAIEPVNLVYADPRSSRRMLLSDFALRFDMPSLADRPVKAVIQGSLAVDGHQPESLELTADLRRIVTANRHIRPAMALVAIKASLPGTVIALQGGLHEPAGFALNTRIDLPRLMAMAGPFLPPAAPKIAGEIGLDVRAKADPSHDLRAELLLDGSRLAVSGGRLRQGRVGPLDMKLRQNIVSDHRRQQVRFADGSAAVGSMLAAAWEATVDRPASRDRDLTARLGPVRVDLQQAYAAAGSLLPPNSPLRELSGEMLLENLSARLQGRGNLGEITLSGLGVTLPRLRLALPRGGVVAEGLDLAVDRASIPIAAFKPVRTDAALSYALRRCAVAGPSPVNAEGVRGSLRLAVRDLNLKSRSPRRIAAVVDLNQSLDLQRFVLAQNLAVDALHEQATGRITAGDNGEIELSLPELKLTAAALKATVAGKSIRPLPLTADLAVAGIRLPAPKAAALPLVDRASCTVAGGGLHLSATAGVTAGAPQLATIDGYLKADLDRLVPLAASFLPKGVAAGGATSMTWSLAVPLSFRPLPKEKNPLRTARAAMALVDRADVSVVMANRGITLPVGNDAVRIDGVQTARPIRFSLPGKRGKIALDGDIAFAGLSNLPGKGRGMPPQNGSLAVHGELSDWQHLRLHEELRVEPLGLLQKGDARVSRIDALLEKSDVITIASLMQRLDAVLSADVVATFPASPTPLPGGVELAGESSAGLQVNLVAGRTLRLLAQAKARDLSLRLKNATRAEGVRADLLIDRTYALAKAEEAGWTPLSLSLVHPSPDRLPAAGAAEIAARLREDMRGQEHGSRRFTIRRVIADTGKVPLELTSLEGDLLLTPEEMGLSFFQADLLGGTVRLRGLIDLKPDVPAVSAACSFTNLETALLQPPEVRKQSRKSGQDTEITGEISLDALLHTAQRELLEGVRMRLNLRKIGADTLERALFGLDPYERNEQLVAQRKMLRHGRLKSLRAATQDGAFSIEGEVQVKGVDISIPKVERVRLSELQIRKQMQKATDGVTSLRKVLELVRADTLVVGQDGKISLVRRGHE